MSSPAHRDAYLGDPAHSWPQDVRVFRWLSGWLASLLTRALLQSVRDAATNIDAWKEVQELVQAISDAQLAREELRQTLPP